jgi:tetratricopeptide (TPR) repeat protein
MTLTRPRRLPLRYANIALRSGARVSAVRQTKRAVAVGVLMVVAAPIISPVAAETQQQIDWCANKNHAYSSDLRIGGCTAVIQSGRWSGQGLVWAFTNRCGAYGEKGDHDRAIADCNRAIALDPKHARAYMRRGVVYSAKGNLRRAITDYDEAIRLEPKFALPYYNRGNAYRDKGDLDRAIADFTEVIQLDPKHANAYFNRCSARAWLGRDLPQALVDCNEALQLNPKAADVLNLRGLVELKLGSFDSAVADYGAALAQNPKDADSLYGRGIARKKLGDTASGDSDIAAAEVIKSDIAKVYVGYGVK